MAYIKQNFKNGDILKAEQLNNIEDGIITNNKDLEGKINNFTTVSDITNKKVTELEQNLTTVSDKIEKLESLPPPEVVWETASITTTNGADSSSYPDSRSRTKTYIPVEASILKVKNTVEVLWLFYDENKNWLQTLPSIYGYTNLQKNAAFDINNLSPDSSAKYYRLLIKTNDSILGNYYLDVAYTSTEVKTGLRPELDALKKEVGTYSTSITSLQEEDEKIWTTVGHSNMVVTFTETNWELGQLDTAKGTVGSGAVENRLRTGNFIPIEYSNLSVKKATSCLFLFYDESQSFIETLPSTYGWTSCEGDFSIKKFSPKDTAKYYKIFCQTSNNYNFGDDRFTITKVEDGASGLVKEVEELKAKKFSKANEIIVDCNGNGDYTTIEEALAAANDSATNHVIIRVMAGTYHPAPKTGFDAVPYQESRRNLSIIGDNRNKVILRGDVGYYYYQTGVDYGILRLSGNVTIENLTILSYGTNYTAVATENGWDLTSPHCRAYCIHVDAERNEGDMVLIKDCIMENDHFTCVGFGLRPNSTLRFENCDMKMNILDDSLSGGSKYAALYGHLAAGKAGLNQKLEVVNCRITNTNYPQAINLMDGSNQTEAGAVTASAQLINNVCKTTDTANGFIMTTAYDYWKLDDLSYGNNIAKMNKTQ